MSPFHFPYSSSYSTLLTFKCRKRFSLISLHKCKLFSFYIRIKIYNKYILDTFLWYFILGIFAEVCRVVGILIHLVIFHGNYAEQVVSQHHHGYSCKPGAKDQNFSIEHGQVSASLKGQISYFTGQGLSNSGSSFFFTSFSVTDPYSPAKILTLICIYFPTPPQATLFSFCFVCLNILSRRSSSFQIIVSLIRH